MSRLHRSALYLLSAVLCLAWHQSVRADYFYIDQVYSSPTSIALDDSERSTLAASLFSQPVPALDQPSFSPPGWQMLPDGRMVVSLRSLFGEWCGFLGQSSPFQIQLWSSMPTTALLTVACVSMLIEISHFKLPSHTVFLFRPPR